MVFGRSGMGKTMLAATLPQPIIISAESGLLSLSRENIVRIYGEGAWGVNYDPINVIKIKTMQDLATALTWCKDPNNHQYFQSIMLDSLTELAEVVLKNAKGLVKDPRQAYGALLEEMMDGARQFRDIPNKHVVLVCKEEQFKDELTGSNRMGPMMPGTKLSAQLPYLVDEVFALRMGRAPDGSKYRYIQTQPDMQYEAKDRSGRLAEAEFPHMGMIFNKILGVSQ
ncbi:ATP-binding protein [Bdellovibrio sp. 22V]|uniref:ATP-binding protein n=1 Tax=Bdellovibrio sp. 22V TaxID=3044166 RepID=UPI002543A2C4|nr:ATP-binding protein [Bdellovibrio sp. 22V]WII71735.1 ATP-binding protein [Bdellovibrio sp. 22V]